MTCAFINLPTYAISICETLSIYSHFNLRLLFNIIGLLLLSTLANAQQWKLYATSDFNYYFQDENAIFIEPLDSVLVVELAKIQKRLNYYTNKPIDVFVGQESSTPAELSQFRDMKEGHIVLRRSQVRANVNQSISAISSQFRIAAAQILIDEMMYGGTLQDKIKSANLVNLPSWVLPGLVSYLATDWSVEDDNSFRSLYDQYGISDFNSIPTSFDYLKGASFWKYMEFKYGDNAIPTTLYMSRLTRKFNAAIYYSFQTSLNDIFLDWKSYYTRAYEVDQKKPNPLGGISFSKKQLLDYVVLNVDEYYTLENTWKGPIVFYHSISKLSKEKVYRLSSTEKVSGIIGQDLKIAENEVYLAVKRGEYSIIKNIFNETSISLYRTKSPITGYQFHNGALYILSSQLNRSTILKVQDQQIDTLLKSGVFLNSFSVADDRLAYIATGSDYQIVSFQYGRDLDTLLESKSPINQLIFAGDTVLLYNSAENGIWNGKLLNVNSRASYNVTNYRSNISSHQYSDKVFVESLDKGSVKAIYITDHIAAKDFYTYDRVSDAYFFKELNRNDASESLVTRLSVDSLEEYAFQSPAHPPTDFILSNYDSLQAVIKNASSFGINAREAPQLYKAQTAYLKISNVPINYSTSAYAGSYALQLPNYLNIGTGISFANQYDTRSVSLHYLGILQAGARDIGLSFQSKVKANKQTISLFHRKRTLYLTDFRNKYLSTLCSYEIEKELNSSLSWSNMAILRNEQDIVLLTNELSTGQSDQKKWIAGMESSLSLNKNFSTSKLTSQIVVRPMVNLETRGWNISAVYTADYRKRLGRHMNLSTSINTGTSQGSTPVFYILGGKKNDLLLDDYSRDFSNYKTPMLYENQFGVRGFSANYRNGNTYFISAVEIDFNIVDMLLKRPIASEVFGNLAIHGFSDIGTSYYDNSIFSSANTLSKRGIPSAAGGIAATVYGLKNPIIGAVGTGISTKIYGYQLRLDYAYGIEDQKIKSGVFHLGIGSKF